MAILNSDTNLTGTITLSKATGTKVTLDTDHKYLSKDIELTINAPTTSATVSGLTVSYGDGWITGGSTTCSDANLLAANIKKDVTIFGVTGTMAAEALVISDTLDTNGGTIRTITTSTTPTMLQQKININPSTTAVTVTPDNGYDGMTSVQVNGDADLVANNIKSGVNIFGVTGTYGGDSEVPTFTINWDNNGNPQSVTCDKTFAECQALVRNENLAAIIKSIYPEIDAPVYDPGTFYNYNRNDYYHENDNNSLTYMAIFNDFFAYSITYASNGTITIEEDMKTNIIIPTFRMRFSNGTFSNFSCDQTFSECKSMYYYTIQIIIYTYDSDYGWYPTTFFHANMTQNESSYMTWQAILDDENIATFELTYNSNGTITVNQSPVSTRTSSDLTSSVLTVTAPAGYYATAASKTLTDASLTASNIKSGTTIFGVTGSYTGSSVSLQAKTNINPTTSSQTITADNGYDGLSSVQINAMPTGSAVITATKDTVNNHSVQVTPDASVQTAGYFALGNYSGAAVTVSASELVSGNKVITQGGTNVDVTNYATASVANGSASGPSTVSGTSAIVSTSTNTLTLTKTVSITPTVSAGYVSAGTATNATVTLTGSVTTKAAATITPGTSNQTIASGTYLTGTQTISGDSNLVASNIISGKSIFGVSGSVVIQNYYTGSSVPSSSLGSNGDIYLKTS